MVWWFSNKDSIGLTRWSGNGSSGCVRLRPILSSSDSVVWWFSNDNSVSTTWWGNNSGGCSVRCDQYSVVVTVWFGGSLTKTVSVPPGGAVTVVVVV